MRKAEERRIAHQIVTAGRSNPCEYEYVEEGPRITKSHVIAVALTVLMISLVAVPSLARAGTTNITTYFDVQSQVSVSVSFPTGLTNISFLDTTPHSSLNMTATGQTIFTGGTGAITAAVEIGNTGDTNITSLTAAFDATFPQFGHQINFFALASSYNSTAPLTNEGASTGVRYVWWKPANYSNIQSLIGSAIGQPTVLNPYSYPWGAWAENVYVDAWATFPPNIYAGQATDTLTITYSA